MKFKGLTNFSRAEHCQECGSPRGVLRELGRTFVVGGRESKRKVSWSRVMCDRCWADIVRVTINIDLD